MRLTDYLEKDLVVEDFHAGDKAEVLSFLVARLAEQCPEIDADEALKVFQEREKLGSTGIGDGVAIPHGKLAGMPRPLVLFARSRQGVPFDSLDGKPCHLIFLVAAPEGGAGLHLRILAHISRLARDPAMYRAMLDAPGFDALWQIFSGV